MALEKSAGSAPQAIIDLTDFCNLNCVQCYHADIGQSEFPIDQLENTCSQIFEYGISQLCFSGGEPFLYSHIDEVIDLCRRHNDQVFVFATNGHLLTPALMKKIVPLDNVIIQISVDGVDRETYESQRGSGTFDAFQRAVDLLCSSGHKHITARTCLTALNCARVESIYRYLADRNILPSFIFVSKMGNAIENWETLEPTIQQKLDVIKTIIALSKEYDLPCSLPLPVSQCNFAESRKIGSLLISTSGDVSSCQFYCNVPLGNIFVQSLNEIAHSEVLTNRCEIAHRRKEHLSKSQKCASCGLQNICGYGCMAVAEQSGNIYGFDGMCAFRRTYYTLVKLKKI